MEELLLQWMLTLVQNTSSTGMWTQDLTLDKKLPSKSNFKVCIFSEGFSRAQVPQELSSCLFSSLSALSRTSFTPAQRANTTEKFQCQGTSLMLIAINKNVKFNKQLQNIPSSHKERGFPCPFPGQPPPATAEQNWYHKLISHLHLKQTLFAIKAVYHIVLLGPHNSCSQQILNYFLSSDTENQIATKADASTGSQLPLLKNKYCSATSPDTMAKTAPLQWWMKWAEIEAEAFQGRSCSE